MFINTDWILPNYHSNTLILVPKTKDANTLWQYRPIALANFKYKIIFKILADRLSSILPTLISKEQKGFVSGRNIKDAICLAFEAINILPNKSFSGNVALKIDIAKAFDTLSWEFLINTIKAFGFNDKFCGINGKAIGYFKCSNGVRQGDPLSPLLFCLAEDVLSRAISNLVSPNQMNLIKANRKCFVNSHTLFDDDIMIFCRGDIKSLKVISNLLKDYASCSGQFCNYSKSLIYVGGMSFNRHCSLAEIIGFTKAKPPFMYLGVPLFVGKPKACHFFHVADNIRVKLASWKAKLLSIAGRMQLVKTVTFSMMIHNMSIYNWPASIIKKGGGLDEKLHLEWMHRQQKAHNCSLERLLQHWSKLLSERVRRNGKFIKYSIKSSIWSGIREAYDLVSENYILIVGNGNKTPYGWSIKDNLQMAFPSLLSKISIVSIPDFNVEDSLVWKYSTHGDLSFQTAYNTIIKPSLSKLWSIFLGDKDSPPSHSMVVWRYIHHKIPTDDNYSIRGFNLPSMCSLCNSQSETMDHLFFGCSFVTKLWHWLESKCDINFKILCFNNFLKLINISWSAQALVVIKVSIVGIFHQVWKARNKIRQEHLNIPWNSCIASIAAQVKMAGNSSCRKSNSTIPNFTMLKRFDVTLNPSKTARYVDVIWTPPLQDWTNVMWMV
ncbi:uncharacterized protein LOC131658030 [Vicia villosa]|uniref:uncharacterized protein LOC131658030 n=1 Tax=Vicia villosa TaxID=3911 RepID=UPI00273BA878|nr:uncharacterized protein LOC131658030 [Vicia villosa]